MNKKIRLSAVLVAAMLLSACASGHKRTAATTTRDGYAEASERTAEQYRNAGNDGMARYFECEAVKARSTRKQDCRVNDPYNEPYSSQDRTWK